MFSLKGFQCSSLISLSYCTYLQTPINMFAVNEFVFPINKLWDKRVLNSATFVQADNINIEFVKFNKEKNLRYRGDRSTLYEWASPRPVFVEKLWGYFFRLTALYGAFWCFTQSIARLRCCSKQGLLLWQHTLLRVTHHVTTPLRLHSKWCPLRGIQRILGH